MSVNDLNLRILASVETDPCKLNPSEWSHPQSYKRDVVSISLYLTIASIWVPFRPSIDLGDLLPKLDALQGPALSQFDKCRKLARRGCGGLRYGCACVLHVATGEGREGSGFVN